MTYYELFTKAENLLIYNKISLGEYDKMVQPLNEEVRKEGRWETVYFKTIPTDRISKAKKCSVCGKRKDKYVVWNFCPNCGAKMKGE